MSAAMTTAVDESGRPIKLRKPREMANILRCDPITLRRYRARGIITHGVYHVPGTRTTLYDEAAILAQLREIRNFPPQA